MEAFLANLKVVLPIIGLELLKPRPHGSVKVEASGSELMGIVSPQIRFEVRHRSGIKAFAVEEEGEFVVLEGSEALKDAGYARNNYARLKKELIVDHILEPTPDGTKYRFTRAYPFHSPSAAGSVILDRNTNGRARWHLVGSKLNYHEWQEGKTASEAEAEARGDPLPGARPALHHL
jgi:Domain of unknown function (DUF4357)